MNKLLIKKLFYINVNYCESTIFKQIGVGVK